MKGPCWWELRAWPAVRYYLLKSIGRTQFDEDWWVVDVIKIGSRFWRGISTAKGRATTKKIVKLLCDDGEHREAFQAMLALQGPYARTKSWLLALVEKPKPLPPTPAERRALKRKRAIEHAQHMLDKHERALEREKAAVARWRRKLTALSRAAMRTRTYTGKTAAPRVA